MTAAARPARAAPRSREVLARLAVAEADALRLTVLHPEQRGAWDQASRLIHADPQLAATTLLALAAMVPDDVDAAALMARVDQLHAPQRR